MDFRSSSEHITGTPRRPAGCPAWQTTLPLMNFGCPTTRYQAGGPVVRGGSLHHGVPRTGFGYPLRDVHHRPSRRLRTGASMGLTLQGFLLDRGRCPSRGPCPPDVTHRTSTLPREGGYGVAAFRASLPRRVRAVTGIAGIPAVDPFLGFILPERSPVRPGARFHRGASPLALRRLHVKARPGLRVLQCERVERSVSGPSTLLGFLTFRRTRRSVRHSSGRAYGFASRNMPPKQLIAIHAPQS